MDEQLNRREGRHITGLQVGNGVLIQVDLCIFAMPMGVVFIFPPKKIKFHYMAKNISVAPESHILSPVRRDSFSSPLLIREVLGKNTD